jgi:hypothetical protein
MKRWPTEPVAPSTPATKSVKHKVDSQALRTAFLLREFPVMRRKVFSVHVCGLLIELGFLSQLGFLGLMTRGGVRTRHRSRRSDLTSTETSLEETPIDR